MIPLKFNIDFMKIKHIVFSISFFLMAIGFNLQSQEKLVSVATNPALTRATASVPYKSGSSDTLVLPVRDDFSSASPYPGELIWTDRHVYINQSFAINPPTYGSATFDAIDSTGKVYAGATVESFLADALTSKPVDLFLPADTTVYLSFFYQPQGLGDAPEADDSLIVEFYAPSTRRWHHAWSTPGTSNHDFKIVMINITDSRFLQKGFRFRFRNYASLAASYEPSLKTNADHWHVDYVYLNTGRHFNDTIMTDAAMVAPVGSLLLNYTAMPWEHFKIGGISNVKAIFPIHLNNLSLDRRAFTPIFKVTPVWTTGTGFEKRLLADEVKAFETLKYDATFNYGFSSNEADSALFEVSLDLNQVTSDWIAENDKIISQQLFADYYAYDDGSAEAGYGLVGEGTRTAKLAYRFNNQNSADSLYAIDFYFNRSFADAGRKYFSVAVWSDNENKPGELIYIQAGGVPVYNGINEFQRIELDTAQLVPGNYYIGWIQTTADFLNVGFDRQNNRKSDIFFSRTGEWQQTQFDGALMIRPVFSNKSRKTGTDPIETGNLKNQMVRVFPNPSHNQINIDCGDESVTLRITLSDIQGRTIMNLQETGPTCRISVANVPDGVYFLGINSDSGINTRQKLIIIHE
jgi:hypothetical protein